MLVVFLLHIIRVRGIEPGLGHSTRSLVRSTIVKFLVVVGVILRLTGNNQRLIGARRCPVWIKTDGVRRHRGIDGRLRLRHHGRKGTWRVRSRQVHRKPRACHTSIVENRWTFNSLVDEHGRTGEEANRRVSLWEGLRGIVNNVALGEVCDCWGEPGIISLVKGISARVAGAVLVASVVVMRRGSARWEVLAVVTLIGVLAREGAPVAGDIAIAPSVIVCPVATIAIAVSVTIAGPLAVGLRAAVIPSRGDSWGVPAAMLSGVGGVVIHGCWFGRFVEVDLPVCFKDLFMVSRQRESWARYLLQLRWRSHRRR